MKIVASAGPAASPTRTVPARASEPERFERVYVWQWPIRIFHWVFAISVATLFGTGLLIANPVLTASGEPFGVFVNARVRQIHFIAGFVFTVAYFWRVYWFFAGNRFARSGFPFVWRARWWRDIVRHAWFYLRLEVGEPHLGHNALAGLSYTVFAIGLGLVQIFTGLALFSETNPGGFLDALFGWVLPLLGGSARTHMWHHLAAWGFAVFALFHVYIVLLDANQYRDGLLTSMVTGHKFQRASEREEVGREG